jgi:hypothetical protein
MGYTGNSTGTRYDDVLLIGGRGCPNTKGFAGVTVYIDGEPGIMQVMQHPREVYLGAADPHMVPEQRKRMFKGQHVLLHFVTSMLGEPLENATARLLGPREKPAKPEFLVYAATNCVSVRELAFDILSEMARNNSWPHPKSCGGCHGSQDIGSLGDCKANRRWIAHMLMEQNYIRFQPFKFVLCMENCASNGYMTEKMSNAFKANSVPIYFGGGDVLFDVINRKSFVYWNTSDPLPAQELITYLMKNETAYWEMQQQPILKDGENTIRKYFSVKDNVGGGMLKRKIRKIVYDARDNSTLAT